MLKHLELEQFLSLPVENVAEIVRASDTKVCVFPFNGTRRWFLLEHGMELSDNVAKQYVELTSQGYISTYKLVFDHGVDTIVAPVFGGEIMERGEEYMREIGASVSLLATHPDFIGFYNEYDIRVHFYGDYHKQLSKTPYHHLCDTFEEIARQVSHHRRRRLFYGVCGEDATATIAEYSVKHYQETGKTPSRHELIEMYYGEYIERADIFIGFEKFNVFDYPMLSLGEDNLYFTVAPSLYMTERQFRSILFDHLYLRPTHEPDYFTMSSSDLDFMRQFYNKNREATFGLGEIKGGIWYEKSFLRDKNES
jgi:adenosine tuberculosinyltransferase